MVLSEGGILLAVGLLIGAAGSLITSRFMQGLLYGVQPNDPVTLLAVVFVLAAAGLVACWLPAVRAAKVDPGVALRAE